MKARAKIKGGVVRNTAALGRAAAEYVLAFDRFTRFESYMSDQLTLLAELQEALDAAELECGHQAARHLTRKSSIVEGGVKFSRSTKNTRVVDARALIRAFPEVYKVDGLLKVMLGPFDKVTASGAYDPEQLGEAVSTQTSFKYHVQKEESHGRQD